MPKQINPFAGKKVLGSNNSKKAPKRGKKAKGKGKHPIIVPTIIMPRNTMGLQTPGHS